MADKQAVFTLRVDTGNSVQDVQNFDQAVQSLNKDLKETQTTASQQTGMDQFESKLQELNERLEAGGLSMRDMTRLMKEYQTLAAQSGSQTPIGQQAIQNAAQLKDEIGDLRAATTALASDTVKLDTALAGVETGAAAFQGVQSAIALTGTESEALVQTMVKLQAAQGLVNAVQTVANKLQKDAILGIQVRSALQKAQNFILYGSVAATTAEATATRASAGAKVAMTAATGGANIALKLFRLALISTGIGALVVGIGLLIANFDKVLALFAPLINGFKAIGDAIGLSDFAGEERRKNIAKQYGEERAQIQKTLDSHRAATKLIESRYDRELEVARATGKGVEKLEKEKLNVLLERLKQEAELEKAKGESVLRQLDEETASRKRMNAAQRSILADGRRRIVEANQQNQQALNEQILDYENALKVNAINEEKDRKERNKKASEDAQNRRKAIIDRLKKQFDEELKLQDELEKNKLALITDARQKELATAQQAYDDYKQKFLIERTKDEQAAIDDQFIKGKIKREQYDAQTAKLREDALNKLTAQERQILVTRETKLLQDIQGINKKFDEQELKELAEKEKKKNELRESFLAILRDQFEKQTHEAKKANDDQLKNLDEALKAGAITEGEAYIARIKLANDLADKEKEINKAKNDYIKEQEKKAREEQLKGITKVIEGAQKGLNGLKQVNDLVNQIDQARLNSLQKNRDEDLADLDASMKQQLNNENLTADQRTAIEQKFAQQKYNVQLKAYEQEEKIKKAQFNRDKALRLAQVGIDTASAIVKGIAQFGPPPSPAGIAAIASASIIGITQALAIANQQYQASGAPSPPQLGAGGSAGSLAGASASSFTANTNAQTTDLTTLGQGQGQNVPVSQVVVLESDITGTQNKVKLQEAKTSF
jgi:hypothetical protein